MNRNVFINIAVALFLMVAFTSCKDDKKIYTITFNSNEGSAVSSQNVEEGAKVKKPDDPSRSGFTFSAWYREAVLTNEWNFNTDVVIANITLYAKWTQNMFTVTFNSNGGSEVASQTIAKGAKADEPQPAPIREGFYFDGWYTDNPSHTNKWDFAKQTVTSDITLFAKWEVGVKWEQNGCNLTVLTDDNGTVSVTTITLSYGTFIQITATAKCGYRFVEWQEIKEGVSVLSSIYNPGIFGMQSDPVVLKAIFVPLVVLPDIINIWQNNYGTTKYVFHYDSQNRITEARMRSNIFALNYNADGDLVDYYDPGDPTTWSPSAKFSKYGNKITFISSYHPDVSTVGSVNGEIELNAQELPVKLTYQEETEDGIDYTTYTTTHAVVSLTWQNENLLKKEWKSESVVELIHWSEKESVITKSSTSGAEIYTHDDKKNSFYNCNTPKWFFWWLNYYEYKMIYGFNKNNIKTVTREKVGSIITYEYKYNDDGFPVTRTWEEGWEWIWGYETTTFTETNTYIQE